MKYLFHRHTKMKLSIVILVVVVLLSPRGSEASCLSNFVNAIRGSGFNITPYLSRLTCSPGSTCNGVANSYSADRGVGCSTSCGWVGGCPKKGQNRSFRNLILNYQSCSGSYTSFVVAGVSGLPKCFRQTAPPGTQFIQSCYCCFGFVFDNSTGNCIDPSTCTKGFGVY